jgi:hypothetical protein
MNHKKWTSLIETQNMAELEVAYAIVSECEELTSKMLSRIPIRRNKSRKAEKLLLK